MPGGKLGLIYTEETHNLLKAAPKFRAYLDPSIVVPDLLDWTLAMTVDWPMFMNGPDPGNPPTFPDGLGDCVFAGFGHIAMALTANAQNQIIVPTDSDIGTAYQSTGWNPNDPNSDQGTNPFQGYGYMRDTGICGVKFSGFATIDPTDIDAQRAALYLFGNLGYCVSFPGSWQDAAVWDADNSNIEGGHFIPRFSWNKADPQPPIVSWGKDIPMTDAALRTNVQQVLVAISPSWISPLGTAPNEFDMAALTKDFSVFVANAPA